MLALLRKEAIDGEAKRLKLHRNAFDEQEGHEQQTFTDIEHEEWPPPNEPESEQVDDPVEPPAKKRRLTGKQKYRQVAEHIKGHQGRHQLRMGQAWGSQQQSNSHENRKLRR